MRLEEDRLACLVIVGVLPNGRKEVIALEDGYRESTESWASVLRDLRRRGRVAPLLAIGDGNLGFWVALRDVYPETKEQRYWKHTPALAGSARELANVLDKLPKRLQVKAKEQLHEVMYAPDRASALEEIAVFEQEYSARYPKAVETLRKGTRKLLRALGYHLPGNRRGLSEQAQALVTTHAHEALLRKARARQETAQYHALCRLRSAVERKIGELVYHGLRNTRYVGAQKRHF